MSLADWQKELETVMPRVIELRRALHAHPELGGTEQCTQAVILRELNALGIETNTFRDCYGVMGILRNGEGRCVAIRADMDGLPVQEPEGLDFASGCPGVMHACGHDAHMALALGSAMWLSEHRDRWQGTVKWFFEPAEETFGGGQMMVAQGCLENPKVDYVIGQHMNPRYDAGVFYAKPGFVSGASDEIRLTVRGKGCHGAYPEAGVDAIAIETMMGLPETTAALEAARAVCDLPVLCTFSVSSDGMLYFGGSVLEAAQTLEALGADAVGVNCSSGPDQLESVIRNLREAVEVPIVAKPNAGMPVIDDEGRAVYPMEPAAFGESMKKLIAAGASIVGGCCGTTPDHIAALHAALRGGT